MFDASLVYRQYRDIRCDTLSAQLQLILYMILCIVLDFCANKPRAVSLSHFTAAA